MQTRQVLQTSSPLRELVTTPLALCLLTLTATKIPFSSVLQALDSEDFLARLIEFYVEQQFAQPGDFAPTQPKEDQHRWLAVLARQLQRVRQPIFSLADVQPIWLGRRSRLLYASLFVGSGFLIGPSFFVLLIIWILALLPGPFPSLSTLLFGSPTSWVSLFCPLLLALMAWPTQIKLATMRSWQWEQARKKLRMAHLGGLANTVLWGSVSLLAGLQTNALWPALPFGLVFGLFGWLLIVLLVGLAAGFPSDTLSARFLLVSKMRVRESLKVAMLAALAGIVVCCLMFIGVIALFAAAMVASHDALPISFYTTFAGVIVGFAFLTALMAWCRFGGYAYLLNKVLCLFLRCAKILPWQTEAFLEDAVARGILQPAGAGFMFLHPLVQDYFVRHAENDGV